MDVVKDLAKTNDLPRVKRRRVVITIVMVLTLTMSTMLHGITQKSDYLQDIRAISTYQPIRPVLHPTTKIYPDPVKWLARYSDLGNLTSQGLLSHATSSLGKRPKAALISLVRNSELPGIIQSVSQLEYRWNWKYNYPWVFFNDEPFTEEFKAITRNLTSAHVYYEVVPKEHWSMPEWIDESRFESSLAYLGTIGVGKGWMVSYHHMCRWNSGFFYQHPRLADFDWYWRVEPDVHFYCDINYDIFRFMAETKLTYGFNMAILDDARSFPSLWSKTRAFIARHPHLVHPEADMSWLLDESKTEYNNCQFFSNFEIGSLAFWRSHAVQVYFKYLDKSGGFYYERWGDAPVHTLAVAMFAPKREQWWFRDVGYQHDINAHCPPGREGMCACEKTSVDENFYKLVPMESRQRKPDDTCVRLWLGGEWLVKREGWSAEGEREWGGDGFHGYVRW